MTSTQIETYKTPEQQHSNHLYKQAEVLANTDIVPAHLRGKPAQIYAIVSIGDTLGIAPATAVQSFASINGQVTMSAELMRALILGQGHSITFPVSTRDTCVIKGRRKETGDECVVEYTLEDASIAGLCGIKDGKAYARSSQGKPLSWEKYPRQLLAARATTELARLLFPDVIKGVSYTPEEIGGEYIEDDNKITFEIENAHINGEPIQVDHINDQFNEPPIDSIFDDEPVEPELISDKQLKYLATITSQLPEELKATEIKARDMKYKGRSRKTFTKDEAHDHIEYVLSLHKEE